MEHVVISSAGPNGFIQLGMISQCIENNLISLDHLKGIYASSAGAIIAVLLCMHVSVEDMLDYFIHRPWHKWFKIDVTQFMKNRGIVSSSIFVDLLSPFFMLHDIPLDINLKDFYEKTNIDLHIFTTSVKELKAVDLNHCTFPNLSVIQAVSMSASVPLLFTPVLYEDEYYIDGGMLTHCPVSPYPEQSLVIMIDNVQPSTFDSAFEFIQHLIVKSFNIVCSNIERPIGKHVFCFDSAKYGIDPVLWEKVLTDEAFRKEMIDIGKQFIQEKYSINNNENA